VIHAIQEGIVLVMVQKLNGTLPQAMMGKSVKEKMVGIVIPMLRKENTI
jgi:hypothetical protein